MKKWYPKMTNDHTNEFKMTKTKRVTTLLMEEEDTLNIGYLYHREINRLIIKSRKPDLNENNYLKC